jgi:D-tyrosyl-tRNA(Tyr) deacylase
MRSVVQRVERASVTCNGTTRRISRGLVVLVGIYETDTDADRAWLADKLPNLRIFTDDAGKMNLSVLDIKGSILLVPNFTVAGDAKKGRRPSFDAAMRPERAAPMFDALAADLRAKGVPIETGFFGGDMLVEILNDGPITIILDSRA